MIQKHNEKQIIVTLINYKILTFIIEHFNDSFDMIDQTIAI